MPRMTDLLAAVRAGDVEAARAALDAGADPRRGPLPPLVAAAEHGPRALVELLIRRGALTWQPDASGRTPLDAARVAGQAEIAELLDRPVLSDPAFRAAVAALRRGDVAELERLVTAEPRLLHERAREPDCYGDDYFRDPKLFWFVAFNPIPDVPVPDNLVDVARALLAREAEQADLDYTLELVVTGCAARERGLQAPLIDLLLDAGATATPDTAASALGERETAAAEALLARGVPLTAPVAAALGRTAELPGLLAAGGDAQAALRLAVLNRQTEAARLALAGGADADAFDGHCTALHHAAAHDDVDTIALLLAHGARTDISDRMWHGTPLDWARHERRDRAAALLS
jgi:ankyrin repeat protein